MLPAPGLALRKEDHPRLFVLPGRWRLQECMNQSARPPVAHDPANGNPAGGTSARRALLGSVLGGA